MSTDLPRTSADLADTDLVDAGSSGADTSITPETTRPRLRQVLTAAPAKVRQAGGAVRRKPAPTAGALALAGGVIAVLLLRRRAARAKATRRWVPARFQR
ncbi:hypothetical protein Ade02nite_34320 [Paractinoplanes deccanensis]|uniref:DUF3618 domain-containing protein n=1 Tax=Paractinoplanes deccanensis TaxID=113561 RepID=A0ABQ3Y470_9ACTN|nr:hypothetical protein [Actinoplanes deccanensis]GID74791.1 hypothetical protein Ade02nite_34320 [Actinoplanes deccanensis]